MRFFLAPFPNRKDGEVFLRTGSILERLENRLALPLVNSDVPSCAQLKMLYRQVMLNFLNLEIGVYSLRSMALLRLTRALS